VVRREHEPAVRRQVIEAARVQPVGAEDGRPGERGDVVAMFPEGTRRSKGLVKKHQHRPRTGSARIALTAGVPLVPAAIKGTDRLARLAKLRVVYGEPIPVADLAGLPRREAAKVATERLMTSIRELEESLERG
jgi:1-acyl-sn-glycerol-3-phosphate acyltransferase